MRIIWFTIAWLAGVWTASLLNTTAVTWFAASLSLTLTALLLYHRQARKMGALLLCVGSFCLGAAYYMWALPTIDDSHVAFYNEQTQVVITGLVNDGFSGEKRERVSA